jgi:hypothetical protein
MRVTVTPVPIRWFRTAASVRAGWPAVAGNSVCRKDAELRFRESRLAFFIFESLFEIFFKAIRNPRRCRFAAVVGTAQAAITDNLRPSGACAPPTKPVFFDTDEFLNRLLKAHFLARLNSASPLYGRGFDERGLGASREEFHPVACLLLVVGLRFRAALFRHIRGSDSGPNVIRG